MNHLTKTRFELEHLLGRRQRYGRDVFNREAQYSTSSRDETHTNESDDDRAKSKSETDSKTFSSFMTNIEEQEMLLVAYFVQIDGILKKLNSNVDVCAFLILVCGQQKGLHKNHVG